MREVTCDKGCGKDFIIAKLELERVKDDVKRVGFTCPHCGLYYFSHYTNGKIDKLKEQRVKLLQTTQPRTKKQLANL
ncbi:hypothetical protein ABNF65_16365 [Paenibacillus larvae]